MEAHCYDIYIIKGGSRERFASFFSLDNAEMFLKSLGQKPGEKYAIVESWVLNS